MSDDIANKHDRPKWMTASLAVGGVESVDRAQGVIHGAKIVTAGEAKGHGVSLDAEFVQAVVQLAGQERTGLKARFGHPNMCSTALGTFLGRWKNFQIADGGTTARADLYLSKSAQKAPTGDLYDYVLSLADKSAGDPGAFGVSIVFTPGAYYKRDATGEKVMYPGDMPEDTTTIKQRQDAWQQYQTIPGPEYVECAALHAADTVDDPAANDGLFSAWSSSTLAAQVTEFLDTHPEAFDLAAAHPEILDSFLKRYELTKNRKENAMAAEAAKAAPTPEAVPTPAPATETPAPPAAVPVVAASAPAAPPPVVVAPAAPPAPALFDIDTLRQMHREFGAEIAVTVASNGGTYADALKLHSAAVATENEALRAKVAELSAAPAAAGTPAKAGGNPQPAKDAAKKGIFTNIPRI